MLTQAEILLIQKRNYKQFNNIYKPVTYNAEAVLDD